ncbi:MAG: hypothetical protein A3F17_06500 [Gammaproteobacteria bacterium RIFCSPHIGHO2_12_FULL_41_15]|nr:MAG: hypothetical protein A3F17_06500 [Gammaproteobacteria bacterium RIFCSPHIGHO2_12_FULL_41_15]
MKKSIIVLSMLTGLYAWQANAANLSICPDLNNTCWQVYDLHGQRIVFGLGNTSEPSKNGTYLMSNGWMPDTLGMVWINGTCTQKALKESGNQGFSNTNSTLDVQDPTDTNGQLSTVSGTVGNKNDPILPQAATEITCSSAGTTA